HPIRGTVLAVGGALDSTTRRAPVYIALADVVDVVDSAAGNLRAGMYARARIAGTIEGGIAVPTSAVLLGPAGSTFVFVQTGESTFTRRPVVIGHPVDGRVPVLAGLRPGEALVTAGALLLDGAVDALL
ncbi:MAG TPA: efflux RND transporter periplasmic adaptor subunit, partial [Myxococcota bacterium]